MTEADLCARCGQPDRLGLTRCRLCTFAFCHSCAVLHDMERLRKRLAGEQPLCDRVREVAETHAYMRMCDDYDRLGQPHPTGGPDPTPDDFVLARRLYASTVWGRKPAC